jgi:DNA polymerase III delta prime subunit
VPEVNAEPTEPEEPAEDRSEPAGPLEESGAERGAAEVEATLDTPAVGAPEERAKAELDRGQPEDSRPEAGPDSQPEAELDPQPEAGSDPQPVALPELPADLELEVQGRVSLAAWQNGFPVVRALRIRARENVSLPESRLRLWLDPELGEVATYDVGALPAGGAFDERGWDVRLGGAALESRTERTRARVIAELSAEGFAPVRAAADVELLAANEWAGVAAPLELLSAFVLPNASAVEGLLDAVGGRLANRTDSDALDGYQRRSRERAAEMLRAVYETVQATGVGYVSSPASFEVSGQKVRTPGQLLEHKRGCCLDLAVMQAALAEQCGLHPFVVIVQGHAFSGAWLEEFSLKVATLEDPAALRKRIKLGQALVVDSSSLAEGVDFEEARRTAERALEDPARFVAVVDVHRARLEGVRPLSLSADGSAFAADAATVARHGDRSRPLPLPVIGALAARPIALPDEFEAVDGGPREVTRLDRWRQRLLDLSLRNKLLNFREGRSAVPFEGLDLAGLEDALADERTFKLLPRVESGSAAPDPEVLAARLREDQADGRLRSRLTEAELEHRLLELYRRSRSSVEETGAITLYLALGVLRWFESSSSQKARRAPLVLVPVELVRARGQEPYRLRIAQDETRLNGTLLHKLAADFGLEDPGFAATPTDERGLDVQQILQRFRRLVLEQDRWDVEETCHLAQFSFAKHLMWLDLEANVERLKRNDVVRHLFEGAGGFPWKRVPPGEHELDESRPPGGVFTPMAADPSQLQAVLAAAEGNSFVLQGPPGTGKSQTIANLIGQLLGEGKSVLFVAEKQAALEVVQRRLAKIGLDPWCLELHSQDASKREAIEQLKAPFETAPPARTEEWERSTAELHQVRRELNRYAEALGTPTPGGGTLFEALGRAVRHREAGTPTVAWSPEHADAERLHAQRRVVERLDNAGAALGPPAAHPLRELGSSAWDPAVEREAAAELSDVRERLQALRAAQHGVDEVLGLIPAADVGAVAARAPLAEALGSGRAYPKGLLLGDAATSGGFKERLARAREILGRLAERNAHWERAGRVFEPAVLGLELAEIEATYARSKDAIALIRWFKLSLFGPRKQLVAVAVGGQLPEPSAVLAALGAARAVQAEDLWLAQREAEARALFGAAWVGPNADAAALAAGLAAAEELRRLALESAAREEQPEAVERWLGLASERSEWLDPTLPAGRALALARESRAAWERAGAALRTRLGLDAGALEGTWEVVDERLERWSANLPRWRDWSALVEACSDGRALGLAGLVDAFLSGTIAREQLGDVLEHSAAVALWEQAMARDERLRRFRGFEHEAVIERFRLLDERHAELARDRVARVLSERVPDLGAPGSEMDLLRRQFQLKRRHRPLRQLFQEMPETLRRLKPVVLMSPLSVARYLDPAIEPFDVVVFDEASQIPPWDAVGAIARGKQVVVVGDSKQLPPTTFFDTLGDEDDEEADEQDLVELESILDEMVAAGLPQLYLRWHYRSRHESLIAFSNHHYYENRLLTFPSPAGAGDGLGVEWRPVADGHYDRGRSRTNRAEAEAVVAELLRCLEEDPERSVGVVTFSMPQQRLVEDLLDAARAARPDLEPAFGHEDPPFVKNLENVQGDERDVMLFSIGYGPDESGRVSMNFGAINRTGGERRLNVAVTRAKRRLVVFSTLTAEHLDLDRTRALGVAHLKSFLAYAARGAAVLNPNLSSPERSAHPGDFESEVAAVLRAAGHTVHERIGVSGYRIDLAVVDPTQEDRYLIGIECDGATYYASRTARERDKGRAQVLGFLGWRLTRVWAVDWWFDPQATRAKLLAEVEELRQAALEPEPEAESEPESEPEHDELDAEADSNDSNDSGDPQAAPESIQFERLESAATSAVHPAAGAGHASEAETAPETSAPLSVDERLERLESEPLPRPPFARTFELPQRRRRGDSERFYEPDRVERIAEQLVDLIAAAGPLQRDQAYREVIECYGLGTLGKRIRGILDGALASRAGRLVSDADGFLWEAGADRDDRELLRLPAEGSERTERDADQLPPLEIANAAAWVISRAKSIEREALIRETAKLFGIVRLGRHVRTAMDRGVEHLLERGGVAVDGERLTLADTPA